MEQAARAFLPPGATVLLVCWGLPAVALAAAVLGSHLTDRPISEFTRDIAAVAHLPPWIGMISNIGVLLWCASATVPLAVALLGLHQGRRGPAIRFLLMLGLLSSALMLDDLFMLHEFVLPRFFNASERVLFAVYGVLLFLIVVRFRRLYPDTSAFFLLTALVCFALSLSIDFLPEASPWHSYLLEDGFKLLGTANWLAFSLQASLPLVILAEPGDVQPRRTTGRSG